MKKKQRRNGHIRLLTHPGNNGEKPLPIRWGAATPEARGPLIATLTGTGDRNVIGAHSGSYAIYRALAVAFGALDPSHQPDLTNTRPTKQIGPHPSWADPDRIVSLDPYGHLVGEVFARELAAGLQHSAHDRGHDRAHRLAGDPRGDCGRPPCARRQGAARVGRLRGHQGSDRAGLVSARRGQALRHRRDRAAPHAVRGDRRHVSGAGHARRPRGVPAADRRSNPVHVRRRRVRSPIRTCR